MYLGRPESGMYFPGIRSKSQGGGGSGCEVDLLQELQAFSLEAVPNIYLGVLHLLQVQGL